MSAFLLVYITINGVKKLYVMLKICTNIIKSIDIVRLWIYHNIIKYSYNDKKQNRPGNFII